MPADFNKIQLKIDDLKAKVAQNSISPAYLGMILDDFIEVLPPFSTITADLCALRAKISMSLPVLCADEEDLAAKAASDEYPVGQQFYIPEND